ncbi:unnamed protein product [Lactuca saligna]|uniref:Uncharacterized protein n=1 Tax=Lactuca saligna TaxID=75948 RepID=A0AA35Y4G1_LACSI|nr:unnamed protein product [Lactuca saligna]
MVEAQAAPTPLAPLLLRNILLPLFIYSDKTLINLSHKFKLFHIIRYTLITAFLFFLKVIPSFISYSLHPNQNQNHNSDPELDSDSGPHPWVPFLKGNDAADGSLVDETCIARALTQLLAIINEIPVSSRKYEIVRSYAEKLMNENLEEGYEPLRKVNAKVLSAAFSRALQQLQSAAVAAAKYDIEKNTATGGDVTKKGGGYFGLNRVIKTVGHYGDFAWTQFTKPKTRLRVSAEKLSAELLWLAEKLVACGSADEAVRQWASASKLACVALSAQQRLQGSLVKLSVYLFKEAVSMGGQDDDVEELRKVKTKLLMSWLPFLCRATIGVEAPVLNFNEKAELENMLGKLIESLKHEEEQEKVLSLWLHHYAHCPSSDWPNLHQYYDRWCTASRNLFILQGKQEK